MTYRDLMLRSLLRVTGQPRSHLEDVIDYVVANGTGPAEMDEELSPERQATLETAFADEASGVLAWYVRQMTGNEEMIQNRARALQRENSPTRGRGRRN